MIFLLASCITVDKIWKVSRVNKPPTSSSLFIYIYHLLSSDVWYIYRGFHASLKLNARGKKMMNGKCFERKKTSLLKSHKNQKMSQPVPLQKLNYKNFKLQLMNISKDCVKSHLKRHQKLRQNSLSFFFRGRFHNPVCMSSAILLVHCLSTLLNPMIADLSSWNLTWHQNHCCFTKPNQQCKAQKKTLLKLSLNLFHIESETVS
jgi:hypothetical protein